jgi:hypothetical protein
MVPVLQEALTRHHIRLTDEGELFLRLYCAVSVRRISEGYPLPDFMPKMWKRTCAMPRRISR